VAESLGGLDLASWSDEIVHLLGRIGQEASSGTQWHQFTAARHLAREVWGFINVAVPDFEDVGWLACALNHPAGQLAEFWVHAAIHDRNTTGDAWVGVPAELASDLERLLSGADNRTKIAQVMIAARTHFFHHVDQSWCKRHVFPLFDWNDPDRAARCWDGHLNWGRFTERMLRDGFRQRYTQLIGHAGDFAADAGEQLRHHLAALTLFDLDADPLYWPMRIVTSTHPNLAVEWINQVAHLLDDLPPAAVEDQWVRWIRRYWQRRLDSDPVTLTATEASAMTAWVLRLTDAFAEGVRLALQHRAGLDAHGLLLHHLKRHVPTTPRPTADLLTHLLEGGTPAPFHYCYEAARSRWRCTHRASTFTTWSCRRQLKTDQGAAIQF
jgi:hypothetical protein